MKDEGETVVGCEKPDGVDFSQRQFSGLGPHTLDDLLSSVDLVNFLLEDLVALLADFNELGARNA